jgi:hypothetical protein
MQTNNLTKANNILKTLPDNLLQEAVQYIEFLYYKEKSTQKETIPQWHKKTLDERLENYHKNPNDVMNFDLMMQDLRKKYNL